MNLFNKFILFFDILGEKPSFFINGFHSQKTIFGSIISFVLFLSIFALFLIFSFDIIYHENPKLLRTNYIDEIPEQYSFDKNFIFAIVLEYPNYTKFINEKIYTLKIHETNYSYINGTSVINSVREIKYKRCSEFKFEVLPEYFEELDINNIYCLNLTNYSIEGEYMRNRWRTILFNFEKCINSSENNFTCESTEKIENILSGGYIEIFMTDNTIIPNNYKKPIKIFGRNIFNSLDAKDYSEFWIYLKRMEVITDNGIIFHNFKKKYAMAYDRINYIKFTSHQNLFLQTALKLSTTREVYHRSYKKIQEICADVSGLSKAILIVFKLFFYIFKKTFYKNYLLQFFNLDTKSEKYNMKYIRKKNEDFKSSKFLPNKYFNNIPTIINNKENNINISNSNVNLKFCNSDNKNNILSLKFLTEKKKNTIIVNSEDNFVVKQKKINIKKIGNQKHIFQNPFFFHYLCVNKHNSFFQIHHKFLLIKFLFEIGTYIKKINEINIIKKTLFDEKINSGLNKIYHFNYNFENEKQEYERLIDYNQNFLLSVFL